MERTTSPETRGPPKNVSAFLSTLKERKRASIRDVSITPGGVKKRNGRTFGRNGLVPKLGGDKLGSGSASGEGLGGTVGLDRRRKGRLRENQAEFSRK